MLYSVIQRNCNEILVILASENTGSKRLQSTNVTRDRDVEEWSKV